jgi:metabolite-proton symporter
LPRKRYAEQELTVNLRRVLFASFIGNAIEYFDFFVYGTAAVLIFPQLFFPPGDPAVATLQSLATFALAFLARPFGAILFGHFGDRIGRKVTLVATLLTMGVSTIAIGLLPTYAQAGVLAPALLALCRVGQGIGLGGEWGGAVLLATENVPVAKRTWYGMFPQMGAAVGFILANGAFLLLGAVLTESQFFAWGWRLPFLASLLLVLLGLYVRLQLTDTPEFRRTVERNERVSMPVVSVLRQHARTLMLATFMAFAVFVLFYLMTTFTLTWGTTQLGLARQDLLILQIIAMAFLAAAIPLSALIAERIGRTNMLIVSTLLIVLFGMVFGALFGNGGLFPVLLTLTVGLTLMGLTYGPMSSAMTELFPAPVRYTGASLAVTLAGILGGSFAPYIAAWLASHYGIAYVGYYLSAAGMVTLAALMLTRRQEIATTGIYNACVLPAGATVEALAESYLPDYTDPDVWRSHGPHRSGSHQQRWRSSLDRADKARW